MNSLENIWYRFDHDIITEEEAMKEFFELKATECDKQSQVNRLIRNISESFQKKIDKEAEKYINSVYYERNTENE
jgi:Holliday junction resolvase-like predicted endonuclease